MSDHLQVFKPSVRSLRAYTLTPERARIKINQNENPFDLPRAIKDEVLRRWADQAWSRYPDFVPQDLNDRIAAFTNWTPDGVLAGNGSNELLQGLLATTLGEGRKLLLSEPTFAIYRQIATVQSAEVVSVPLTAGLQHDAARIRETIIERQPEISLICSPNNPTGCVIDDAALIEILNAARGLVVVDEAYFEFAEHTVAPLMREHKNLIVTRTFSKAMAAAALRIGYMLAAPEIVREVNKAVLPYNLNRFSQIVAETTLEMYDEHLRPLVETMMRERDRLFDGLRSIDGITPTPTRANFIVVECAGDPTQIFRSLAEQDILVRDVSKQLMLSRHLRISVGTPEENDLLLATLTEIVAAPRAARSNAAD